MFLKADFPRRVIENTISNFNNIDEELIIPRWSIDERKTVVINLPFSSKNEHFPERSCKNLKLNIIWATKKINPLFKTKDNVKYLSCVINQGICSCRNSYVGETMKPPAARIDEHEQVIKLSSYLSNISGNKFDWITLTPFKMKNLRS